MPKITSKQLFVHELQDMYYAEKLLARELPKLASEASDSELSRAFKTHHGQTLKQIQNLERVFEQIGERPQGEQCPGIEGIKKEHDHFMEEKQPTGQLRDVFLTGAGSRAEHYEIAAYTGLVGMAKAMGERRSAELLETNLKQEKEALKKVETISRRIVKEAAKPASRASDGRRASTSRRASTRASAPKRRSTSTSSRTSR